MGTSAVASDFAWLSIGTEISKPVTFPSETFLAISRVVAPQPHPMSKTSESLYKCNFDRAFSRFKWSKFNNIFQGLFWCWFSKKYIF